MNNDLKTAAPDSGKKQTSEVDYDGLTKPGRAWSEQEERALTGGVKKGEEYYAAPSINFTGIPRPVDKIPASKPIREESTTAQEDYARLKAALKSPKRFSWAEEEGKDRKIVETGQGSGRNT